MFNSIFHQVLILYYFTMVFDSSNTFYRFQQGFTGFQPGLNNFPIGLNRLLTGFLLKGIVIFTCFL